MAENTAHGRLETLHALEILDTPAEAEFDRLTELAATLLDVPVSLVSLVGPDTQFFKSCVGLPEPWSTSRETPLTHSFCRFAVESNAPLVVADARIHPLVESNPAIQDLGVIAYLGVPFFAENGHCLGSFCVIDDKPRDWQDRDLEIVRGLAKSVESEIRLRESLRRLTAESQQKSIFLAQLSHELRNPLSPVYSAAQMLANQEVEPEELAEVSRVLLDQTTQLVGLVDDLLDLSRIEQGKISLQKVATNLNEAIHESVQATACLFEEKEQRLEILTPDDSLWVSGERRRLVQVITNLLTNAARYTPIGGNIRISLVVGEEKRCVQIRVSDDGAGIAPDQVDQVFQLFGQAKATEPTRQNGLGIGLALVRQLVELHDGDISIDPNSELGGCTMLVRLPLLVGVTAETTKSEKESRSTETRSTDSAFSERQEPLEILLVDDQRAILFMLQRLLENRGHRVKTAGSAKSALEQLQQHSFDLVFSDISMPVCNGFDFLRMIRAEPAFASIPVVALTGSVAQSEVAACAEAGFNDFLAKPIDIEQIEQVIARQAGKVRS
ncbi:hybrid sensor histidine kinase/response regulator [Mariniblastus fucicola]|uniref:hybrid sensor histidine kinase/response regulator n=1 Tax=Mariniblastus fucicola TaxID=980251 RepID=UPI00138FD2AF|nr:response regulator [Mariniblastus fucicola]